VKAHFQRLLIALLLTGAVWTVFSWPLPKYVTEGIPAGAQKRTGESTVQRMIAGDHLQLLYHFWLLGDMVAGETPWFHNLYEFNTGDDAERYEPGSYYVPFSLFYALGASVAGRAFGWNFSGFLSLGLTLFFTHALARRYGSRESLAWAVSLVSIMLPYRWISLTGGSPTGFAMMWVPALLLGLDMAVKDDRWLGGLLAGLAILFAAWGDAHVFFFSALVTPCWCVIALLHRRNFPWRRPAAWLRMAITLAPVALLAALAFWSSRTTSGHIETSRASQGRTISEVALSSPRAAGLWSSDELGVTNHIYVGYLAAALLALALAVLLVSAFRRPRERLRDAVVLVLLVLGIAGIVMLSMGPYGPFDGRALTAARKFIEPYRMIRQPAKVFSLLPSIFAVAVVLGLGAARLRGPGLAGAALLIALGFGWEYRRQIHPIICLLDGDQAAYAAVREAAAPEPPRALVITLWPGDSHYTAVYEYFASLYRVRLVNGYRPFVAQDYTDRIFHRFESGNMGAFDGSQLDELLRRGVNYLIFHEDLFPEKVSPFPATFTLRHLLNNPRLAFLSQDGPVWAFRILKKPGSPGDLGATWRTSFPARRMEFERAKLSGSVAIESDPAASGGRFIRMNAIGAETVFKPVATVDAPALRWLVRMRGHGAIRFARFLSDASAGDLPMRIDADEWQWRVLPWSAFDGYQALYFRAQLIDGSVDCDQALLTAGDWDIEAGGGRLSLPAPEFFHAGHTDLETDSVVLVPGRDRRDLLFYGPKLPLPQGDYRVALSFDSPAAAGTALGTCYVACPEDHELARFPIIAGQPAATNVYVDSNLPFLIAVQFSGQGQLRISEVEVEKTR
jgi:hypothetical protein